MSIKSQTVQRLREFAELIREHGYCSENVREAMNNAYGERKLLRLMRFQVKTARDQQARDNNRGLDEETRKTLVWCAEASRKAALNFHQVGMEVTPVKARQIANQIAEDQGFEDRAEEIAYSNEVMQMMASDRGYVKRLVKTCL